MLLGFASPIPFSFGDGEWGESEGEGEGEGEAGLDKVLLASAAEHRYK